MKPRHLKLTPAQQRMLSEVQAAGVRRYNGRARAQVEALHSADLVVYDYELLPSARGSWSVRFTVWLRGTPEATPCRGGS